MSDLTARPVDTSLIDPASLKVDESAAAGVVREMTAHEANHLFTALRKAANHPLLLRVRYTDPAVLEKIAMIAYSAGHFGNQCDFQRVRDEIESLSDFDIHQLCLEYGPLNSLQLEASVLYDSPKMDWLKVMLPQLQVNSYLCLCRCVLGPTCLIRSIKLIASLCFFRVFFSQREGHRVLVFSQWTRLLDLLEVLLQDIQLGYLRLDGSTPVKERQAYIDTFNTDISIPVFLLSTKAGGLGINLTAADTVVLHDLDFNPENDKQAEVCKKYHLYRISWENTADFNNLPFFHVRQDRCHRIGQTRPVTVYKLFCEESVDEDIYDMGERKSKLSKAVLQDDRVAASSGDAAAAATGAGSGTGKAKGGRGKAKKGEEGAEGEGGAGGADEASGSAISNILQKALLKRVQMFAQQSQSQSQEVVAKK
jgi:SWI/SNF-related matrix-associated actin-dependent regulator 1 of chromatin subfamily A